MEYMMLDPKTNECKGFVNSETVKKELGINQTKFKALVMYQRLYRGCILIEDEVYGTDNDVEMFELVAESKTGTRWYISNFLNVISVNKHGKTKQLHPIYDSHSLSERVMINGKMYSLNRLAYEKFVAKPSKNMKVRLKGEKNVKNLYLECNNAGRTEKNKIKVQVDGKIYKSITECAKDYAYTPQAIRLMLNGKVKNVLQVSYI